jgi:hypothetical protein
MAAKDSLSAHRDGRRWKFSCAAQRGVMQMSHLPH